MGTAWVATDALGAPAEVLPPAARGRLRDAGPAGRARGRSLLGFLTGAREYGSTGVARPAVVSHGLQHVALRGLLHCRKRFPST